MAKDIKEMAQAEDDLLNMEQPKQAEFIKNYKARAWHEWTRFKQHTGDFCYRGIDWYIALSKPLRQQKKRTIWARKPTDDRNT